MIPDPSKLQLPQAKSPTSQIHLRVTRSRKAGYVRAASSKGQTLADWCFDALDRAAILQPVVAGAAISQP